VKLALAACLVLAAPAAAQEANWPTFRGADRTGHSPDRGLLKAWPAGGPKLAWKAKGLGKGYASVAVWGDKLYTLGDSPDCNLICLNAADGKELWRLKVGGPYTKWSGNRESWGFNRATPTTDGKIVIGLAPTGELVCADAATGKEKWRKEAKADFGGSVGGWDYSESPLIDGDLVVFVPGGSKGAVAALNKDTGATVWTCKEYTDKAEYASLVPVEIGGVRQYLAYTQESVAGVGAKDGKLLWRAERKGKTAVIPTPVHKDGIVFVSSGYGVGHNAFKVESAGGSFKAAEIYKGEDLQNHHGGIILVGDHVYGISDKGGLTCIEIKTGKVVWQERKVAKGAIAYADGLLVCRAEDKGKGTVVLCEANPAAYKELGRFDQPDLSGMPTWAHPVVIGGRLYLRDMDTLLVYDVKGK
jgi:outer membrane protein assembly factor BamB